MSLRDDLLETLRGDVREQWATFLEELGASQHDIASIVDQIPADFDAALAAGDVDTLRKIEHQMIGLMTRHGILAREAARDRMLSIAGRAFDVLAQIAASALRKIPTAVILFGLALSLSGCAFLRQGSIPTIGVRGLAGDVCSINTECKQGGFADGAEAACQSLEAALADDTVEASAIEAPVDVVCLQNEGCLQRWLDLPEYKRRTYGRSCDVLVSIIDAALGQEISETPVLDAGQPVN